MHEHIRLVFEKNCNYIVQEYVLHFPAEKKRVHTKYIFNLKS